VKYLHPKIAIENEKLVVGCGDMERAKNDISIKKG